MSRPMLAALLVLATACDPAPELDAGGADGGRADGGSDGGPPGDGGAVDAGDDAAAAPDAGSDPCTEPGVHCYYLSPTGDDGATGTIDEPWFTLVRAWGELAPGDVLYLRGGTYAYDTSQYLQSTNGAEGARIRIWGFPGEDPVITRGPGYVVLPGVSQDLIYLEGDYLHFRDIEIANFDQRAGETPYPAFRAGYTNHSIFERIDYHHNASGFQIRGASEGNLVVDSDFHHNQDPFGADGAGTSAYDGADGLNMTFNPDAGGAPNVIRACRAYWNADDGFDLWSNDGDVVIEGSWAFYNGYVPGTFEPAGNGTGFKLGITGAAPESVRRTVRGCLGHRNRSHGIVENEANVRSLIYNNTMTDSGEFGYWFGDWHPELVATLRNNISWNNPGASWSEMGGEEVNAVSIVGHNSWQDGIVVTAADFESLDADQLLLPRGPDGALPRITFLRPAAGSDLIDRGIDVGAPFSGAAPDIGAFER